MRFFRRRTAPKPRTVHVAYQQGLLRAWAWVDSDGVARTAFASPRALREDLLICAVADLLAVHDPTRPLEVVLPGPTLLAELDGTAPTPLHAQHLREILVSHRALVRAIDGTANPAQQHLARWQDAQASPEPLVLACDGSFNPRTGIGAWAYVGRDGSRSSGVIGDAGNAMDCELAAAIAALAQTHVDVPVELHIDARALVELIRYVCVTGSVPTWMCIRLETTAAKMEPLAALLANRRVWARWVKGHADNQLHNTADQLARETRYAAETDNVARGDQRSHATAA